MTSTPAVSSDPLPTTVAGTLRYALKLYDDIHDSSPSDANYQKDVALAISLFLRLWSHVVNEGIFRRGETLREMPDLNMELIPVPFYLGVLCEKKIVTGNNNNNNNQQQQQSSRARQENDDITQRVARSSGRLQSLTASNDFFFKFLAVTVELKLATEKDVATKPFLTSLDRAARVDMTKLRFALEKEVKQLEGQIQLAKARVKRNQRIMKLDEEQFGKKNISNNSNNTALGGGLVSDDFDDNDDDEGDDAGENNNSNTTSEEAHHRKRLREEEKAENLSDEFIESVLMDDDDYQSNKRDRSVRFAEWAILETYSILQGNSREMEMLGSLSDSEKRKAIEDFQHSLKTGGGGPKTSTSASSVAFNQLAASSSSLTTNVDAQESNYTVLPGGKVVPFGSASNPSVNRRQEIRDEAFMNRNMPTQTLADFADGEMAYMRMMQEREQRMKNARQTEDERIGEGGVEERDRAEKAEWDDWRDANPTVGITSKGNYS